jgi:lysine biosynthesis protein LysW
LQPGKHKNHIGGKRLIMIIDTDWGRLEIGNTPLELGELLITDEGVELEVTGLDPLRLIEAPHEDEDWGE